MPDLWSTTDKQRLAAAERFAENTGAKLMRVDPLVTGLWVNVRLRRPDATGDRARPYWVKLTPEHIRTLLV